MLTRGILICNQDNCFLLLLGHGRLKRAFGDSGRDMPGKPPITFNRWTKPLNSIRIAHTQDDGYVKKQLLVGAALSITISFSDQSAHDPGIVYSPRDKTSSFPALSLTHAHSLILKSPDAGGSQAVLISKVITP